jgi:hypothetical protein
MVMALVKQYGLYGLLAVFDLEMHEIHALSYLASCIIPAVPQQP